MPDGDYNLEYSPPVSLIDANTCYVFSGIPIDRLLKLDIYEYRIILVNAFVLEMSKTEEGQRSLREFANLSKHNTEFDTASLMSIL